MIVPFAIQIVDFLKQFGHQKLSSLNKALGNTVNKVAKIYSDRLKAEANSKLGDVKKEYVDSIIVEKLNDTETSVRLDVKVNSKLSLLIEKGSKPFDMKPGFLRSSKAKISKKGIKYIRIPIGDKQGVKNIITVTENTPANKFIHPGFKGKNLMDETLSKMDIQKEYDNELRNEIKKLEIN